MCSSPYAADGETLDIHGPDEGCDGWPGILIDYLGYEALIVEKMWGRDECSSESMLMRAEVISLSSSVGYVYIR